MSDVSWSVVVYGSATRCRAGNCGVQDQPGDSPQGATSQPDAGIRAKEIVRQPRSDAAEVTTSALAVIGTKLMVVTSRQPRTDCEWARLKTQAGASVGPIT